MGRVWTDEQLSAIQSRDKTLLVSAAAGSGKTATLTERVIRQLTDAKAPADITSMLVVTFTKAAASELRAKIRRALEDAVLDDPENEALRRQLYLLPSAKIRTIDSFCSDVLRANCDRVGINAGYRIADTAECRLLATSIINTMLDAIYDGALPEVATAEELESLAECLTDSKRTEELSEVLLAVYESTEAEECGVEALLPLIERYRPESFTTVEDSFYGAYLMRVTHEMLDYYRGAVSDILRELSSGTDPEVRCADTAGEDLAVLRAACDTTDYATLGAILAEGFTTRMPPVKKADKTESILAYAELRGMMKEDAKKYAEYFLYTEDMWRDLFAGLYSGLTTLYKFLCHFDASFFEEKRRRSAFSYADVERLCYRCLIRDGKPTDVAENMAAQFSFVYIDEYQDVNALQNRIFEAVSRPNNRFMVGDIKQSIYGFRSARPEIFADMRRKFPPLSDADGDGASIFMSKNFRCDAGVVDFVNGIFDRAFALIGDSIDYSESDRLVYAKVHEGAEPPYRRPVVYMADKPPKKSLPALLEEGEDGSELEPIMVAERIRDLLAQGTLDSGEPVKPSDIAIILRNAKNRAAKYAEALGKLGVPAEISDAKDFFLSPEILLVLCLLNSIDNPRRDIYLAGAMCSPLFSFTADDLYRIRSREGATKGETLYEALCDYVAKHPDYERGARFLERLGYYRAIAEGVGVDSLLYKLYHETGLLALAAAGDGRENLMVLYDYARGYEAGAFKGLYSFISYINNLIDKKTTFDEPRSSDNPDAVRIVTCHGSKGLEYPIVFLADAGRAIRDMDAASRLVYSGGFGIAYRLRTPSGLATVDNPVRDLINHYSYEKMYEEELRILYVALTRAREQLYCVGTCPKTDSDAYITKIRALREHLAPYALRRLSSFLDIILVAGESGGYESIYPEARADEPTDESTTDAARPEDFNTKDADSGAAGYDGELCRELIDRFTYSYPNPYLSTLPEKMSVSKASPSVLDGTEESTVIITDTQMRRLPAFMEGRAAEESAKRGIATHYFMQFCDLARLENDGAEAELSRLLAEGYISKADADRVRLEEIELFKKSRLFAEMKSARRLYRELRFNVRIPATRFTENEEAARAFGERTVLVQGVIDCIAELEDGELLVVDYKTDRLSREELENPEAARLTLSQRHGVQLSYYAMATERMFGKAPSRIEVYSLPLGDTVDVSTPVED